VGPGRRRVEVREGPGMCQECTIYYSSRLRLNKIGEREAGGAERKKRGEYKTVW
jgi:hypothetical protein